MNRDEANQALELIRRVVSQARDDSALQNWGVIWMLHGFTNAAGFAGTQWLWTGGHRTPQAYVVLWALVLGFNIVTIFLLKRGQTAGARSFIERQIWAIWSTFVGGMVLVALCNWLLGLDRLFMPAMSCVLFATAFSMMGALMGRVWFAVAAFFAAMALVMTRLPDHAYGLLAGLWLVVQCGGGLALHRARLRRLASQRPEARLV
ncbi:hypothetical protein OWM54_01565 [Myxococcus sp. MISCRS1]|uniref:hypothetical protein n=1 Tax=unclassified Myxococcus TaxID=2648731 RepID=UPI001CBAD1CF|nr:MULTISPECIES: hypothetical protein [unclassified Myxococcus]MBZ4399410.1 hypothetical protein [Myxococcus sp. AS-1-15]MCY0995818.1 hypothetical protein [Myxococcus sp. MISCRS1]BDT34199.1 hypothetical protein MFMH1_38680 [Myxococcus sp. MH1]